ncbi:MAG: TIGR00730 family Rossman fold protein [Rhabdaerophilum sp.]
MKNTLIRSVCVFCGSGTGSEPIFMDSAETLGRLMAENGLRLVYGGGSHGLMGAVARSVLSHGGHVTGIIPHFLKNKEVMLEGAQEMIVTNDMHERKRLMFEKADAFVALPGGIGTLEELVEQLTWAQLGQHNKPILLANIAGFWKPLLVLLAHMREFQFIRAGLEVQYLVAESVPDILPMLEQGALMKSRQSA